MSKQSQEGITLQLQKFSVNDGEGIRTVLFLPGCPLRCRWCSNPESWDLEACISGNASFLCEKTSVEKIISSVERDAVFFRYSDGGVTFSGGEPTVQQEFLRALTYKFYDKGISTWIETCGYFDFDEVRDIFTKMEHIFYDIKCMDNVMHKELTGVNNELILENAVKVYKLGIPITVRIPSIKDVNFTKENLVATAQFMQKNLNGAKVEFLPYHNLGKEKYEKLGLFESFHDFTPPTADEISEAKILFEKYGIESVEYR